MQRSGPLPIYPSCIPGVGKEGKSRDPGSSSKKKAQRFSKSDHEALADIFKKIGKKELSKVGSVLLINQGLLFLQQKNFFSKQQTVN